MVSERFESDLEKHEVSFEERITGLRDQVIDRLGGIEAHARFTQFIYKLYEARPDCTSYKVYHWFKNSTPRPEDKEGDFEGEYSVEAFLESLLEEKENPSSQ